MTVLGCWFWDNRFGNIQRFGAGAQSLKEPIDIVWSKQGFYAVSGSMLEKPTIGMPQALPRLAGHLHIVSNTDETIANKY
jgi:hypothetical protein